MQHHAWVGSAVNNPDDWDDDDHNNQEDETTHFILVSASIPGPSGEEIKMKMMHLEKSVLPERSCAETAFSSSMQLQSEEAWFAAKNLFPSMSMGYRAAQWADFELKCLEPAKKLYNLMTAAKGAGEMRVNKNLLKEI